MTYAVLDVETTIFQKGTPYADCNRLCLVGLRIDGHNSVYDIEYSSTPYDEQLRELTALLYSVDCIVGFNLKFDLGWLARYGIFLPTNTRVFDCQLAEFILDSQRLPFSSLNDCLSKYGLGSKSDVVERNYWDLGIDTPVIPMEVLYPYLETDLEKTDELYLQCLSNMRPSGRESLFSLHMQDLRVLQEMEFNGIQFDWATMEQKALEAEQELGNINEQIRSYVPSSFREQFNANSGDHTSALLYGRDIQWREGTPYLHTYKTGPRAGKSESRYKWNDHIEHFPRLVDPPEGSELKKHGFFSVDEETLKSIKTTRHSRVLVEALLRRSKVEKLLSTYYRGIPAHREKYDWADGKVHGTYNQCRAITGRLSSEKPNMQNLPEELNQYIITRFDIGSAKISTLETVNVV